MSAIKKEALGYINEIPDSKLRALLPLLSVLVNDTLVIETNLTNEEKAIVREGRNEYKNGMFISLKDVRSVGET
jgi:hypothetical protein